MENANDELDNETQQIEEDSDMQEKEEKDEEIKDEDEDEDFKDEEEELEKAESEKINTLKFKIPKQKNMYFNEQHVLELINRYQKSLVYDENRKIIKKDEDAEQEILANLLLIARAIINKYSYWRFAEVEDMESECLKECWKYLPKFDTTKGTAFNLFSILCKRHLLNYTLRLAKHRLTADIDIHPEKEAEQEENYSFFFEGMESNFLKIINEHYVKDKRKKYIELTSILMEYLDKNRTIVGKNDLISAFREYGYKSSDYKEFISDMKQYEKSFYDLAS
jgi:hypothetical protein